MTRHNTKNPTKAPNAAGLMLIELIAVSERRCSEAESQCEDNGVGGRGGEPVRQQVNDRTQHRRHDRNREKRHKHQRHCVVKRRMPGARSSWNWQVVLLVDLVHVTVKLLVPCFRLASSASGGRRTRPLNAT